MTGSVTTDRRRDIELAPLSAGSGYGRGLRALAKTPKAIGRAWREFVEVAGRQTYYRVGPSPWMVRDTEERNSRRDDRGGDRRDDRRSPPSEARTRTEPADANGRRQTEPDMLVGAR